MRDLLGSREKAACARRQAEMGKAKDMIAAKSRFRNAMSSVWAADLPLLRGKPELPLLVRTTEGLLTSRVRVLRLTYVTPQPPNRYCDADICRWWSPKTAEMQG
jgi:hypothetical protein